MNAGSAAPSACRMKVSGLHSTEALQRITEHAPLGRRLRRRPGRQRWCRGSERRRAGALAAPGAPSPAGPAAAEERPLPPAWPAHCPPHCSTRHIRWTSHHIKHPVCCDLRRVDCAAACTRHRLVICRATDMQSTIATAGYAVHCTLYSEALSVCSWVAMTQPSHFGTRIGQRHEAGRRQGRLPVGVGGNENG